MAEEIVKFIRRHDYHLVRELGQGACGKTVLLYDHLIDEYFVCKKFTPYREDRRQELFDNFVRESLSNSEAAGIKVAWSCIRPTRPSRPKRCRWRPSSTKS